MVLTSWKDSGVIQQSSNATKIRLQLTKEMTEVQPLVRSSC